MTVSEAQIERLLRNCDNVRVWLDKGNHANVAILLREIIEALAMKAAEPLQQGDEVERAVAAMWQADVAPEILAAIGSEMETLARAALVRSKLPAPRICKVCGTPEGQPHRYRHRPQYEDVSVGGARERVARALCVVSGQDPDALDPCAICDRDNKPLPLWMAFLEEADAAITAIGSQSIEGERAHD